MVNLKEAFKQSGLTLSELAAKANVSIGTVHNVLKGNARDSSFEAVCDVLGVPFRETFEEALKQAVASGGSFEIRDLDYTVAVGVPAEDGTFLVEAAYSKYDTLSKRKASKKLEELNLRYGV